MSIFQAEIVDPRRELPRNLIAKNDLEIVQECLQGALNSPGATQIESNRRPNHYLPMQKDVKIRPSSASVASRSQPLPNASQADRRSIATSSASNLRLSSAS